MRQRLRYLVVLVIALTSMPAGAEPQCTVPVEVWELQLEQVAAEAGSPNLEAAAAALGMEAILRGGYRDPGRRRHPVRVSLTGAGEGAGLNLNLETPP